MKDKRSNEEIDLDRADVIVGFFDPGDDKILGVFDGVVHIRTLCDVILHIPREEYLRVLNLWLLKKQEYCERYGHYCGVFGTFDPVEQETLEPVTIADQDDLPPFKKYKILCTTIRVDKFEDRCDMEHG